MILVVLIFLVVPSKNIVSNKPKIKSGVAFVLNIKRYIKINKKKYHLSSM